MGSDKRSKIIALAAFVIIFFFMIAALMYNGQGAWSMTVSGLVYDENGIPISGADVGFCDETGYMFYTNTDTDENGAYSLTVRSDDLLSYILIAQCPDPWTEMKELKFAQGQGSIVLDFVLANDPTINMTLGTVVLASTFDGSTRLDIEVSPAVGYKYYDSSKDPWGGYPNTDGVLYQNSSDHASFLTCGKQAHVTRTYSEASGRALSWLPYLSGEFGLINLTSDYLQPDDVNSNCTFYNLSQGEQVAIYASLNHNVSVPEQLLQFECKDVLGNNVSIPLKCDLIASPWNVANTSVTITPLTPGVHTYKVCIEDDFIIHVWEMSII